MQPYYVDEFLFDDDPLLSAEERRKQPLYGGSGILKPVKENGMLVARRDIVLGLNIPGYPTKRAVETAPVFINQ